MNKVDIDKKKSLFNKDKSYVVKNLLIILY